MLPARAGAGIGVAVAEGVTRVNIVSGTSVAVSVDVGDKVIVTVGDAVAVGGVDDKAADRSSANAV